MKRFAIFPVIVIAIAACTSTTDNQSSGQDSIATASSGNVEQEALTFEGLDAESLTTELLKQSPMKGTVLSSEPLSDKVLDVSDLETNRELIAIWIQTGVGEYQGARESEYETVYSRLAVFEVVDTVTRLLDMQDFESSSHGLLLYTENVETFDLTPTRQGLVVHHESSESGAGDGGFEKDEIEVFAIKDGKLYSIFTATLMDNQFVSDEMGSYYERNSKGELTVLESKTNGLFDISVNTITTENSVEADEEGEEAETEAEPQEATADAAESNEDQAGADERIEEGTASEPTPPLVIYSWNGEQYVPADSDSL